MPREPVMAELEAEAEHTATRVALYQQKLYSGRGDTRRLAELQREAAGAAERLSRARTRAADALS
jgi:multidrug resistance efflux pump